MPLTDKSHRHNALTVVARLAGRSPQHVGILEQAIRRGLPDSIEGTVMVVRETGGHAAAILLAIAEEGVPENLLALLEHIGHESLALAPVVRAARRSLTAVPADQLSDGLADVYRKHLRPESPRGAAMLRPITPEFAAAYITKGSSGASDERHARALLLLDDAEAQSRLPWSETAREAAASAVTALDALRHSPFALVHIPRSYAALARAHLQAGQYGEALRAAEKSLGLQRLLHMGSPTLAVSAAHLEGAAALTGLGEHEAALRRVSTAIENLRRLYADDRWYLADGPVDRAHPLLSAMPAAPAVEIAPGAAKRIFTTDVDAAMVYRLILDRRIHNFDIDPRDVVFWDRPSTGDVLVTLAEAWLLRSRVERRLGDENAVRSVERAMDILRALTTEDTDRHSTRLAEATVESVRVSLRLSDDDRAFERSERAVQLAEFCEFHSGGAFSSLVIEAWLHRAEAARRTGAYDELLSALVRLAGIRGRAPLRLDPEESPDELTEAAESFARMAESVARFDAADVMTDIAIRLSSIGAQFAEDRSRHREHAAILHNLRARINTKWGREEKALSFMQTAISLVEGQPYTENRVILYATFCMNAAIRGQPPSGARIEDALDALIDKVPHRLRDDVKLWTAAVTLAGARWHDGTAGANTAERFMRCADVLLESLPDALDDESGRLLQNVVRIIVDAQERAAVEWLRLGHAGVLRAPDKSAAELFARSALADCWRSVDDDRPDRAIVSLRYLDDVATRFRSNLTPYAMAALDLCDWYLSAGRAALAVRIGKRARRAITSSAYLRERHADLGQPPTLFLFQVAPLVTAYAWNRRRRPIALIVRFPAEKTSIWFLSDGGRRTVRVRRAA